MFRTLFIEKGKNTKTNNFKARNIGKIVLKIVKLKVWLMVVLLNQAEWREVKDNSYNFLKTNGKSAKHGYLPPH